MRHDPGAEFNQVEALRREIADLSAEVKRLKGHQELPDTVPANHIHDILGSATGYAIITTDAKGLITWWNEGARLIHGWSEAEACGQHTRLIFTPEDQAAEAAEREMEAAAARGSAENERWHVRKDGSRFYATGLLMPLLDGSRGFLKILRDRTEQLHAERYKLRRLEQMKALAPAARTIMAVEGLAATLDAITTAARDIIGAHQAICSIKRGLDWSQAVTSVSLSDEYAAWKRYDNIPDDSGIYSWVCEGNRTVRMTRAELEAHPRWRGLGEESPSHPPTRGWLAAALVGSDDRNIGLIQLSDKLQGEFDEVDESILVQLAQFAASAIERAQAMEDFRKGETRLRSAFAIKTVGVMFWGEGFGLTDMNEAFLTMTGFTREEALGRTWQELTPEEFHPDSWRAVEEVMTRGETTPYEKQYFRKDGSRWWGLFAARKIGNEVVEFVLDVTERREAEARRCESEERLATIFANATVGLSEVGLDGRFIQANDELCRLLGRSSDELLRHSISDVTHPEDIGPSLVALAQAIETGSAASLDKRYLRPDGTVVWAQSSIGRLHDGQGRLGNVLVATADLTARKLAEQALRDSEARFRAAVHAVQGVLWTNNAHGEMVGEQPGWAALTGQSFDEYQGHGWASAVHPDDAKASIESWNEAVRERKTYIFEHRVRRHDGQWRLFSIRAIPTFDANGSVREWVGVHTDISERKFAQEALARETERLQILNRVGAHLASELDLGKLVQEAVDAAVALTGAQFGAFFYNVEDERNERYMLYTLSGVPREAFSKFPMPRNTAVFSPTFSGEGVVRSDDITKDPRYGKHDTYHGMPAGHLPVTSYLAVPVISRSGEVLGGLFFGHELPAVFTDEHEYLLSGIAGQAASAIDNARLFQASQREIAERRRAEEALKTLNETLEGRVVQEVLERSKTEEALRQAQKMEAIGQLTGGVAHDFNNLLTIIRSSTDLLRRPGLPEERRRRYVDAIADTVDRASKLTGQLLAFARRQALKPEVFDVPERIRAVSEMLRTIVGGRIRIVTDIACEQCLVEADVTQFETALVNMVVNARDAMDGEGTLTVRVEAMAQMPALRGHAGSAGAFVAVSLADTGHGIPPDDVEKIFEPFFTTKEVGKGTGLGLSQVFGFAKQSGGDVGVRSEVGQGTTFTLCLPRTDQHIDLDHADDPEYAGSVEGRGRRVLVVEDNVDVGTFSTQLLQDLGYQTTWAANAREALDHLASDPTFDVVFSDVVMPGMTGVELAREIRARYPGLPVILTSGYSHVLAEEGRHGFELVQKPYAVEELSRTLRRVSGQRVGP